ncbi:MAG: cytochrome C oxidase subunit IV family protein, partial [Acidobacteria bacterium]|nr:cytochrome C oxidase subunit IV family protein [Acidobacteriota bacterium]
MSTESHTVDIQKHVRWYLRVFAALMILTVVTVAVSYLELTTRLAVAVALFIATIKGSLVACYFMHLISERKFIYTVLIVTVIFFVA